MDTENTLRILLTTDNHVGYLEKDGIRGIDSFKTFEEILSLAQDHEVDFILMAGDLYHESRPSMKCINEVLRLIRTYCLNDKPVQFELLSDAKATFATTSFPSVNYLDPNFNVGMPIFTIHGNHDDPSGVANICAPDLLHTCGFANLFGKSNSVENLEVNPLLIQKGSTKLAVYGIGAVREERLHRLFQHNAVTFLRPKQDASDWFSVSLVHQNRARHGPTGYLPEHFLPDFLDLVIWGHEHDCRIDPEWNSSQNFYVIQPGSSVATSLSEGEAVAKTIGLLEIRGREFKLTKLPLKTVRPFVFEDLVLQDELPNLDPNSLEANKRVEELCTSRIEEAVKQAGKASTSTQGRTQDRSEKLFLPPPEPLIRLRVDTSGGFESFSALRFGQKFVGRVANPKDLITFNRKRDRTAEALQRASSDKDGGNPPSQLVKPPGLSVANVESLVMGILASNEKHKLDLFTEAELSEGLRRFVGHSDNDGIRAVVDKIVAAAQGHLVTQGCSEERIASEVARFATNRKRPDAEDFVVSYPLPASLAKLEDVDRLEDESAGEPALTKRKRPAGARGKKQTKLDFTSVAEPSPAFSSDDDEEAELLEAINDDESDDGVLKSRSSRSSNLTSGFVSMVTNQDSQNSTLSARGVRGRGSSRASRVARGSSRRGTKRSLMPDSDEENEISFDFRRKK